MDTVVHMAGEPAPNALWKDLLDANIIGTYHIFAAAKAAGVQAGSFMRHPSTPFPAIRPTCR